MEHIKKGGTVTYYDEYGRPHDALITNIWWNEEFYGEPGYDPDRPSNPSINLVYITDETSLTDPYGQQIVRKTSVPAKTGQPAHGMYWIP